MLPTPVSSLLGIITMAFWPSLMLSPFHSRFSLACGCCAMWSLEGFLSWGSGPLVLGPSPTPYRSMERIKM